MKFKLVDELEFWWPVKMQVPDAGGRPGKTVLQQMTVRFRHIPKDRLEEIRQAFESLETEEEREAHQDDLLRECVIDWEAKDVEDEDGNETPFNSENLERALGIPWARIGMYRAYMDACLGGAAKRGN